MSVHPSQWAYMHKHAHIRTHTHNTHTHVQYAVRHYVWEQKRLGQSFQVQTHRTSEEGRPNSYHNIVSLVLKVQISMTRRVVPAHHNQFVFSCRSQRLSLINYNNRSFSPCDYIYVCTCVCVYWCVRVCVCLGVCVCARVIEKGI